MSINFPTVKQYNEDGDPATYVVSVGYPNDDSMKIYLTTLETYGNRDGKIFFHDINGIGITLYEDKIKLIKVGAATEEDIEAMKVYIDKLLEASSKLVKGFWLYERPTIRGLIATRLRGLWADLRQI
jgi:hypothetical protein